MEEGAFLHGVSVKYWIEHARDERIVNVPTALEVKTKEKVSDFWTFCFWTAEKA